MNNLCKVTSFFVIYSLYKGTVFFYRKIFYCTDYKPLNIHPKLQTYLKTGQLNYNTTISSLIFLYFRWLYLIVFQLCLIVKSPTNTYIIYRDSRFEINGRSEYRFSIYFRVRSALRDPLQLPVSCAGSVAYTF